MIIENGKLVRVNNSEIINGTFEIPDGVISIGEYAFYGCTSMISLDVPKTVNYIGERAFSGCSNLKRIKIPEGVTTIERDLFAFCSNLETIELPESLKKIEERAFYECIKLSNIKIPEGVTTIEDNAFRKCTSLVNIKIPETTTRISNGAFWECSALSEIQIPKNVTVIGNKAFEGCKSLVKLEVPEAVERIGHEAFLGCSNLTSINIPQGVIHIRRGTFQDCFNLKNVEIPDSVEMIEMSAFLNCKSLTSIRVPEAVPFIDSIVFAGCSGLTDVELPHKLEAILDGAFQNCESLKNIEIPDNVCEIREWAFYGCRNLTSIKIPQYVERIEEETFAECTSLETVEMSENITEIETKAFKDCWSLVNIELPKELAHINERAFSGCSSLSNLTVPKNIEEIGYNAFSRCSNLQEIEITEERMGKKLFEGYRDLKRIKIADGTKIIPARAFANFSELTHIQIPKGVTEIKAGAFQDCFNLISVEIPEGVTKIESGAFSGCISLTSITIPSSVEEIEYNAFGNCDNLTKIEVADGNAYYSDVNGVLYTKDKSVLIKYPPAKEDEEYIVLNGVTRIEPSAFKGCKKLVNVGIPEGIEKIREDTFYNCERLTSIKIPGSVNMIEGNVFRGCTSLTNVELPEGLTSIGKWTFKGCSNLKNIRIPQSIKIIQNGVFEGCTELTDIQIPSGVIHIGERAFMYCRKLINIELPTNLINIGKSAFQNCISLTDIKIPERVSEIRESAFEGCSNITSIKIPEEVCEIGRSTFEGCARLTKLELPVGLQQIGSRALRDCDNLKEIIVPPECAERINLQLYQNAGLDEETAARILFGEYIEAIERIDAKSNFMFSQDYNGKQMTIFYYKMLKSIGIEEIEKIVQLPNLTAEEIRRYSLEKDEAFQQLYNTQYKITGDLGISLKILKQLQLAKTAKQSQEKNSPEIRIFKNLNQKLEQGYEGSLTELISIIIQEEQIEVESNFIQDIKELEKSANKGLIKGNFEKIANQIDQVLSQPNEQYETPIVQMQIEPIRAMVEDVIIDIFREKGNIDLETLKSGLEEKIGNANAPYIIDKKEQIVQSVLRVFEKKENLETINHSCLEALKSTKQSIGGAWKYKINQALRQLGYTFYNLPETLSKEEIDKLSELLGSKQALEIQTTPIAVPKQGIEREKAYKLLEQKGLPEIVTYKQIHDMFGSVYEPYSEKFKEFFKKHRKEFWQNPEYYSRFGQIHNNFEMIINSPELKNIYQKGKLTIDNILGYLSELNYGNQRPGDEELAKLAKSVGKITTEEEFEYVQKIFDITRKRERTTVPPMFITKSKYRGRMLSPDDVLNLFAGNITTCCQVFNDAGEGSMLLGSIEENAGIFVIEELDENGNVKNIVGQSLTIRQKGSDGAYDRLTFDNIEINNDALKQMSKEDQKQILELYQQAGKQAIEKDKKFLGKLLKKGKITQQQYDRLVLKEVIAGTGYNDLDGLKELPTAQIVVPDEAYFKYRMINHSKDYAWIDSAGGKAPRGADEIPVILATMGEEEINQIRQRKKGNIEQEVNTSDVPLWYGKIGKVQNVTEETCRENHIKQIKQIERTVYRESQQLMNKSEVYSVYDIEDEYGIENAQIKIGSNNDWYLIYGDYNGQDIMISDLAVIGGLNAKGAESPLTNNSKLAITEATNELYGILIDSVRNGKKIYCNATADTSLINIIQMLRKGLVEIKTMEGQDIQYIKGKGLVYAESGEVVETQNWNEDGEIQMLDLQIIPNQEELIEAKKKVQQLLQRAQDMVRMKGTQKEKELDTMRKRIRDDNKSQNGRE